MRSTALQGFLFLSLATLGAVGQSSDSSTTLSIRSRIIPSGGPHTSSGSSVTVSTSLPVSSGSTTPGSSTVSTSSGSPSVPTSTAPTSAPASTASASAKPTTSAPSRALSVKASIGGLLGMVAIPLIFQL